MSKLLILLILLCNSKTNINILTITHFMLYLKWSILSLMLLTFLNTLRLSHGIIVLDFLVILLFYRSILTLLPIPSHLLNNLHLNISSRSHILSPADSPSSYPPSISQSPQSASPANPSTPKSPSPTYQLA